MAEIKENLEIQPDKYKLKFDVHMAVIIKITLLWTEDGDSKSFRKLRNLLPD
jgi:hypothetical protein